MSGESIPTSSIARTSDAAVRDDVPIGTRDGEHLRLLLDGKEFDVRPAISRFSRRSYRVDVTVHGHSWLFTPATATAHRLVQGSRYTGNNEIGVFTAAENEVTVEWSQEVRFAGAVAGKVDSTPLDCQARTVAILLQDNRTVEGIKHLVCRHDWRCWVPAPQAAPIPESSVCLAVGAVPDWLPAAERRA